MKAQRRAVWTALLALAVFGSAQALEIRSYTIDGGGGQSDSVRYSLQGTLGQPDARPSVSARYSLDGGFWPKPETSPMGDPVFANGFE